MTRRLIVALAFLTASACGPVKPPVVTPQPATLAFTVTLPAGTDLSGVAAMLYPDNPACSAQQAKLDTIVNSTSSGHYAVLVPPACAGSGADYGAGGPGLISVRTRVVGNDGYTFPQGLPATGSYELKAITLQALPPPIPPPPSREDALNIETHFQGAYVMSNRYSVAYKAIYGGTTGAIPYFGDAFCDFWAVGDGPQVLNQLQGLGDTHVFAAWHRGGNGYDEANQPYGLHQLIPPANLSADDYRACVDTIIKAGLKPVFILDGEGSPAYIQQTLVDEVAQLKVGYDRTAYGPFLVSYDGVWPAAWSVSDMQMVTPWIKSVIGQQAYLGYMYANGPAGNPYLWVVGSDDYQQPWADGIDIVLTTSGPPEAECVSMANKAQYMAVGLNFPAAGCQPSFQGHFVLADNSRGHRVWGNIEWDTYGTVRDPNQLLKAGIDAARAMMIRMGLKVWG